MQTSRTKAAVYVETGRSVGIAISVIAIILVGCTRERDRSPIVEFRVPNGFRGVISVGQSDNASTPELLQGADGQRIIRYDIPKTGELVTEDIAPLLRWHKARATYRNGQKLFVYGTDTVSRTAVTFHNLVGNVSDQGGVDRVYCLVGTRHEAEQFLQTFQVWRHIDTRPPKESETDVSEADERSTTTDDDTGE